VLDHCRGSGTDGQLKEASALHRLPRKRYRFRLKLCNETFYSTVVEV
jgi:hypothetical protein